MEMASRTMYSQGKFTEMRAIAGELLENARRRNDLVQQLWGQVGLVECLLLLDDDLIQASELIEDTLELALASGELGSTMKTYALLALTRMRKGQWQSGEEMANQALEIIGRMQPTSFGMVMQYELAAEIFLTLLEKALETHEISSSRVIHLQNQAQLAIKAMKGFARIFPIGRPGSRLVQGRYSWLVDKKPKAFNIWRQGLAQAQNLSMSYHQALIHYQIGLHLPDADPNRREHLAQAANLFKNMKLPYNLVQAESALNSSGLFWT
jgi:tetratricopeptide (TPR) repeat protein